MHEASARYKATLATKYRRDRRLNIERHCAVLDAVEAIGHPTTWEVARRTGIGRSAVQYHLARLERLERLGRLGRLACSGPGATRSRRLLIRQESA